jgi:methanogenic corrinoid protein MtbC1
VARVVQDRVEILLVSVLMLPSALRVKELRARLTQAGRNIKIAVGGAPFRYDDQLWREVGADAMGRTASDAVKIVRQFVKDMPC